MMAGYHGEHFLIEEEYIVEGCVDGRQKEEECPTQGGISEVTPDLRITKEDGQFCSPIYFGGCRQHDEEDGPEGFATLQEGECEDVDICYDNVVLVTENGL